MWSKFLRSATLKPQLRNRDPVSVTHLKPVSMRHLILYPDRQAMDAMAEQNTPVAESSHCPIVLVCGFLGPSNAHWSQAYWVSPHHTTSVAL